MSLRKTKELMRQKAFLRSPRGSKNPDETLLKMSVAKGSSVNISEKCDKEGFKLIDCFI